MIKVYVELNASSGKISLIEVKGHADSAEEGKDLICAAVSAVTTGGFNSLLDHDNYSFILEKGHAMCKVLDEASDYDAIVLKTIVTQLKTIAESNPAYVNVNEIVKD